jgi:hypothetical protein
MDHKMTGCSCDLWPCTLVADESFAIVITIDGADMVWTHAVRCAWTTGQFAGVRKAVSVLFFVIFPQSLGSKDIKSKAATSSYFRSRGVGRQFWLIVSFVKVLDEQLNDSGVILG